VPATRYDRAALGPRRNHVHAGDSQLVASRVTEPGHELPRAATSCHELDHELGHGLFAARAGWIEEAGGCKLCPWP
jgi:hypothetical protein